MDPAPLSNSSVFTLVDELEGEEPSEKLLDARHFFGPFSLFCKAWAQCASARTFYSWNKQKKHVEREGEWRVFPKRLHGGSISHLRHFKFFVFQFVYLKY